MSLKERLFDGDQYEARTKILQGQAKAQQHQLKAMGYNYDEATGSYNYDDTSDAAQTEKKQTQMKLQQAELMLQQTQNAFIGDKLDQMVTESWNAGSIEPLQGLIQNNPLVKDRVMKQYGAIAIEPLNFGDSKTVEHMASLVGISEESLLKNEELKQTLGRAFFSSRMQDGSSMISSLGKITEELGLMGRITKTQRKNIADALNDINGKIEAGVLSDFIQKEQFKAQLDIQKTKTIAEDKQDRLSQNNVSYFTAVDEAKANLWKDGGLNNDVLAQLEAQRNAEGVKTESLDAAAKQQITGRADLLQGSSNLLDKIDKLAPEEVNKGVFDELMQRYETLKSDEDFNKMTKDDRDKILKTIDLKSSVGMLVAEYVKLISGAAVTDQEFRIHLGNLVGGEYSNIAAMKQAMGAFHNDMKRKFKSSADESFKSSPTFVNDQVRKASKFMREDKKPGQAPEAKDTMGLIRSKLSTEEQAKFDSWPEDKQQRFINSPHGRKLLGGN